MNIKMQFCQMSALFRLKDPFGHLHKSLQSPVY